MPRLGISILGLFVIAAALLAQPPMGGGGSPAGPASGSGAKLVPDALDATDRLDALLLQWEKNMTSVESIYVKDCQRTDKEKTGTKTYVGEARYLKPNLAAFRL